VDLARRQLIDEIDGRRRDVELARLAHEGPQTSGNLRTSRSTHGGRHKDATKDTAADLESLHDGDGDGDAHASEQRDE